ncbi:MAG: hypothetical protein AB1817_16715, partial [Chloroflexota bacterium]
KMCAGCGKPLATQVPPLPKPVPQAPIAPHQPPTPPRQPAQPTPPPAPKPRERSRIACWQIALVVIVLALCACGAAAFLLRDRISRLLTPTSPTMVFPLTTPTPFGVLPPPLFTPTTAAPIPPSLTPVLLTATPMIAPTAIIVPDTLAGATLKPGETWRQNNMMLTLQRQRFAEVSCGGFLEFDLTLENFEPGEIVVNWRGDEVTVKNDQDIPYPQTLFQPSPATTDCARYIPLQGASFLPALGGRKTFGITVQVRGQLDDKVNKIIVIVAKAGRIQNARWEIPVPR